MTPAKLILALAAAARGAAATVQGTGSGTDADPCHTTNCDKAYAPAKGVCYNADGMHGTTCENNAASCGGSWLGVGYLGSDGCCTCEAGCDHSKETGTSCSYTKGLAESTCKYTATIDPFAGPTGYFKFAECGDVAHPVIVMKRGVTYTFDQSDDSNWYHPLGFAYVVDGAKKGDELEPGITQTGDACAGMNTCQAPMYYKNGVFAGAAGYDNTLQWPTGGTDFGLDAYEPDFSIRKED